MLSTWVEFDPAEQARIECNRARFEVVGLPFKCDFDGSRLYGVWDHGLGRLLPGGMCRYYNISVAWIDCITLEHLEAYARDWLVTSAPAVYEPPAARIARHNIAAIDLVANLMDGRTAAGV
jgi:hypothetical protein